MKSLAQTLIVFIIIGMVVMFFNNLFQGSIENDDYAIVNLCEESFYLNLEGVEKNSSLYIFKEDGTFIFRRFYNNDGISEYSGTYELGNYRFSSESLEHREITLNFRSNGEYVDIGGRRRIAKLSHHKSDFTIWTHINEKPYDLMWSQN